jgi:hypothetical protein
MFQQEGLMLQQLLMVPAVLSLGSGATICSTTWQHRSAILMMNWMGMAGN